MGQVTPLFKKTTNSIKQITGLSQCYLCLIICTIDYWQRSRVNSIALFCRILLVPIESSTVVRLHYYWRRMRDWGTGCGGVYGPF